MAPRLNHLVVRRIGKSRCSAGPLGAYPDGLKVGPDGDFYIGQYSSGRIVVVDYKGTLERVLEVPSPVAPNLTFSPDGESAYVTAVDNKRTLLTKARSTKYRSISDPSGGRAKTPLGNSTGVPDQPEFCLPRRSPTEAASNVEVTFA